MFSFTPTGPQHLINEPSTANQASKQTQEAEHKEPSATKEPSANDNREPSATHKEPSANNNREPSANKEPVPQQEPTPSSSRPPETAMQPETVNEQIIGNEAAQSAQTASHLSSSNAQPSPVTQASEGSIVAVQLAGNNEWGELVEQSSLQGMSKELAMHSACEKLGEDEISLSLAPKNKHIYLDARFAEIEAAMSALFNRTMIVKIEFEDSDRETPAECLARLGVQQIEQTKESLQQEPGLQAVMSEFGASIDDSSIEPYTPDQHKPDKS
jgi:DNA polymerase-3 subunit gamma/tau